MPPRAKKRAPPSGAEIVAITRTWIGVPYAYGGTTRSGVDCSGLVMRVAESAGVADCPRTSEAQWLWCQHLRADEVGAGDLVFFVGAEIDPPPGHVGIVVTPGTMIDAPFTGVDVRQDHYADGPGVNRIIGYGRLRGVTGSRSANPYTTSGAGGSGEVAASDTATSVGGIVVAICVILLLLLALAALLGAGMLFA